VDLYEALRNLTGDTVDIVKAATHLRIKWAKGVYKLPVGAPTLQFEEPPRQEPDAYCQMPSAEFHDLLQQVTYWDVTEDDKAYTDVVSFERYKGDQVSVVQCGARMLNHVGITVPTTVQVNQFCLSILSSRLLKKIALLMPGTVSWRTSGRDIEVSFDGLVRIYALGVAVPFPQWRALMPRGGFKWVTVAQRDLQEALRRVAQFEHVTAVFNIIDENLGIRFLTEAGVSGDESIHVQSSTITPTDVIRLPADALYRAVCQHAAGTNVRLRIWGEGSPVVLDSSDNYMQMLAQMRF
jgi:DNA polymerase III sliding clamp (beta) subunit (PCNA family)